MYYNTVSICYMVINGKENLEENRENFELILSILCLYTFIILRTYDGKIQL